MTRTRVKLLFVFRSRYSAVMVLFVAHSMGRSTERGTKKNNSKLDFVRGRKGRVADEIDDRRKFGGISRTSISARDEEASSSRV